MGLFNLLKLCPLSKRIAIAVISLLIFACAGQAPVDKDKKQLLQKYDRSFKALDEETGTSPVERELEEIEKELQNRSDQTSPAESGLIEGTPPWFFNPGHEGYLGAVGMAKKQARGGYAAQKRLAVTIAEAELSRQVEVLVNAELNTSRIVTHAEADASYRVKLRSMSRQESRQMLKNAVVKDEWLDPETGNLHVWLVIEK